MNKFVSVLFCLVLFASVLYAGPADAEDEDVDASVYLVFDPETGDFVTVTDPAVTSRHKARQDQEAIDSVVETTDGTDEAQMPMIIGAALAVILLGGAVWFQRSR